MGSVELSQASVFRTPDAQELERVLAAILEPAREGLLRAALATELMGLDATAIEALAADEVGHAGAHRAISPSTANAGSSKAPAACCAS